VAILLVVTAALSLWFRAAYPPLGIWAAADDALFVRMAGQIAAGGWLGPYDFLVLAKGAFFPAFVAFNKIIGLPLKITEHILYLLVALFAATTLARLTGQRWLLPTAFLALALSPTPWMLEGGARVTREPLYQSLTAALFFLAALHFRNAGKKRWLGLVLGIVGGCYWLTREEGAWLLPTLAVLALPWLAEIRQGVRSQGMAGLRSAVPGLLVPVSAFLLVVLTVNSINFVAYGVFRNNELRSGPFPEAYGALARIKHGEWRRYVVFPRESRQWAYAASPAARELAPYLEGEMGKRWVATSRGYPKPWGCADDPQTCGDEILSGWFVWALRDAVAAAGYHRSARDADAYYKRLADEINAACASQAIPCRDPRATLAPVWRGHYPRDAVTASGNVLLTLLYLNGGEVGIPPSSLTAEQAGIFQSIINSPVSGPAPSTMDATVVSAPLDEARISLTRSFGAFYATASATLAIPALASYFFLLLAWAGVKSAAVSGNTILMLTALLVAVFSRVGLLGFLEATSLPSNNMLYLLPVVPIYFLFVVVSIGAGLVAIRHVARGGRPLAS
jgi:hypothetical protein